jgi:hypothetical protein
VQSSVDFSGKLFSGENLLTNIFFKGLILIFVKYRHCPNKKKEKIADKNICSNNIYG